MSAQTKRSARSRSTRESAASVNTIFHRAAIACADWVGRPAAFFVASASIIVWALIGPWAGFSDTWQLVINTGTTIATFLILFLIQNTQNRDTKALHLKLDELIRALNGARSEFLNLESLSDSDLDKLKKEFKKLQRLPELD
jgi:low affinity Fe/Cu permease